MREIEITVPRSVDLSRADRIVERICGDAGLTLTMKGSLATFPGSIHWHYKSGKQKGTLELTLFASAHRLWAKVQTGRQASWIDDIVPTLKRSLEKELRQRARSAH